MFTNNGTVSADIVGTTLKIENAPSFTNTGTAQATNGGTLDIIGNFTNQGTLQALAGSGVSIVGDYTQSAGTSRVNGGTLTAETFELLGGRLEGSGTIAANVANAAVIAPGLSAGHLDITGDLMLETTSELRTRDWRTQPEHTV